ncbi:unnamed protein product [Hapterophycus canaliculatus]
MSGKEDLSWLSSVIERVDQLALTIGGYEEKPQEHGFSDDESDTTSDVDSASVDSGFEDALDDDGDEDDEDDDDDDDDEDSGFEDAVSSPARSQADDQQKLASGAPPAYPPRGHPVERKGCPVPGADEPPSLSVERRSSPERVHVDDAEGLKGGDRRQVLQEGSRELVLERAERIPGVSPTPSFSDKSFSEEKMPVSEGATLGEEITDGSAATSIQVFGTPSHSRDRSTYARGPPIAASSAGSRRVHRERNRTERLTTSSCEDTRGIAEAVPAHASPPYPSASRPSKKVNGVPLGRANKKTYSHVSDTTWLKRKEDLPENSLSPPELGRELGTAVSVAGSCPASRSRARSTAEEEPASDCAVPPLETAGVLASVSTDGRNQHGFPSEGKHQPRQDIIEGCDQAETDSQVEKPSWREFAEDSKFDERGLADKEDASDETFLVCPEDVAWLDVLHVDAPGEQVDTDGQTEPNEENETGQVGVYQDEALEGGPREDAQENPGHWNLRGATVGAKRASVGISMDTHELDWLLDSPQDPSKRGKVHPRYPLAVMRHSARLDDAIHERQRKLGAMTAGAGNGESVAEKREIHRSKGFENDNVLAAVPWPDRAQRPYDSPIVDTDLPARQAKELYRLGMDSQTFIVCSPFRRCLQTAGVVARTLGVAGVTVHLEVGERMDKVRKEIAELALLNEEEGERSCESKQPAPVFSYLEEADMRGALGAGVRLEQIVGEQPPEEESGVEAKQRFIATIAKVREEQLCDRPVLVVAHGDTLDAAGESLASQIVFEADYCAWALFDLDTHCGYVTESYGIQMIPL